MELILDFPKSSNILLHTGVLDLNLTLSSGEVVAITGENGVGKSSVVQLIKNVQGPRFPGIKLSFIDQFPINVLGQRRGVDLIDLLKDIDSSYQWEDTFFLGDKLTCPISKLSGGENQILKLSAFLSRGADFYLLDEPTNNLDKLRLQKLEDKLVQLKKEGAGILIISHDHNFVDRLADRKIEAALCDGVVEFKEVFDGPT
ncbi:MAG: ABC-F family ATP-binding cassette domain-containing protein [Bacteriovoracaceae bacterium]|nr:ABC-F family ATP-binding cassette domain-containing protein [Bacteriovoracaceae bacterium]